jgi:soluble P-type ATPase
LLPLSARTGVEPQLVVVVDVLVAEGDRVDALAEQAPVFVSDERRVAVVAEAAQRARR